MFVVLNMNIDRTMVVVAVGKIAIGKSAIFLFGFLKYCIRLPLIIYTHFIKWNDHGIDAFFIRHDTVFYQVFYQVLNKLLFFGSSLLIFHRLLLIAHCLFLVTFGLLLIKHRPLLVFFCLD